MDPLTRTAVEGEAGWRMTWQAREEECQLLGPALSREAKGRIMFSQICGRAGGWLPERRGLGASPQRARELQPVTKPANPRSVKVSTYLTRRQGDESRLEGSLTSLFTTREIHLPISIWTGQSNLCVTWMKGRYEISVPKSE